jgi:hypothetical protein
MWCFSLKLCKYAPKDGVFRTPYKNTYLKMVFFLVLGRTGIAIYRKQLGSTGMSIFRVRPRIFTKVHF